MLFESVRGAVLKHHWCCSEASPVLFCNFSDADLQLPRCCSKIPRVLFENFPGAAKLSRTHCQRNCPNWEARSTTSYIRQPAVLHAPVVVQTRDKRHEDTMACTCHRAGGHRGAIVMAPCLPGPGHFRLQPPVGLGGYRVTLASAAALVGC